MSSSDNVDRRSFLGGMALAAGATATLGTTLTSREAGAAEAAAAALGVAQPPPLPSVEGKVAYVTGASSGIGLGISRVLHDAGAKVVLGYIDEAQLQDALKFFPPDDPRVHAIRHDVTDREGWVRTADEIDRKFGRTHLLVNNAGVGLQAQAATGSYKDWEWGLNVNLWGCIYGVHTFVPRMLAHGEGSHIVSVCSTSGILPGSGAGVYVVTKFAVAGLMEELRQELQDTTIGTSLYYPGQTATNLGQSERYRPEALKNAPGEVAQRVGPARTPPARPPGQAPTPGLAQMDPLEAGKWVVDGIVHNDLFIFSHPEWKPGIKMRFDAMLASLPDRKLPPERIPADPLRTPVYAREVVHRLQTRNRSIT